MSQGHPKGPMAYVCGYAQPGSYIAGTCRDSFGVTQHDKCYAAGRSAQGGLAQAAQVRTCDTQPLTSAATADMRGETAELSAAINEAAKASARRFNGAGDYVHVPKLGSYCDLTIDTWLRWAPNFMTPGPDGKVNHPIMCEDNWNMGDMHYQIFDGEFGFDVNGNGDYTYGWQEMRPSTWYYITAIYSCADHLYELQVSTPAAQPNGQLTKVVDEPYDPSRHSSTTAQVRRSMHQDSLLNPRNSSVFSPFFTHFPPFFAHFQRLDARNPENTTRSPGENGKKSRIIGLKGGN